MLDNVKTFKNGNLNCKKDPDFYDNSESPIVNFILDLEDYNCVLLGEEFCLGNYDTGFYIFNFYTDKKYLVSLTDILKIWEKGKTLKLYAIDMEDEDYPLLAD